MALKESETAISVETDEMGTIAFVQLSSADGRNLLNAESYSGLCAHLLELSNDTRVEVIIIRSKASEFCRGVDFEELAAVSDQSLVNDWQQQYMGFIPAIWHNRKLIIAMVRGAALGIGCELALLADITFADETASFGHPEIQAGFVGRTVWPWLVGPKVAKEYLVTGRAMPAKIAAERALINRCLPADELEPFTLKYASEVVKLPRGAIELAKKRVAWAYRDISRNLYDDVHYQLSEGWVAESRSVDLAFYDRINAVGLRQALQERDLAD